jgi:hypothetical protein
VLALLAQHSVCGSSAVILSTNVNPGDNVRIAAALHPLTPLPVYALASDKESRIFFDSNGNERLDRSLNGDTIVSGPMAKGVACTSCLTVWRRLHFEVDTMDPVDTNYLDVQVSSPVVITTSQTIKVKILRDYWTGEHKSFENGYLEGPGTDKQIHRWKILKTDTKWAMLESPQPTQVNTKPVLPDATKHFRLYDDDRKRWTEGQGLPAPPMAPVFAALRGCFIEADTNTMFDSALRPGSLSQSDGFRSCTLDLINSAGIVKDDFVSIYWVGGMRRDMKVVGVFGNSVRLENDGESCGDPPPVSGTSVLLDPNTTSRFQSVLSGETKGDACFFTGEVKAFDASRLNSNAFWVSYVITAFEERAFEDGDPDSSKFTGGVVNQSKSSNQAVLFIEVSLDWQNKGSSENYPGLFTPRNKPQLVNANTVHEVGHAITGNLSETIVPWNRKEPECWTRPLEYTKEYQLNIRRIVQPGGPK